MSSRLAGAPTEAVEPGPVRAEGDGAAAEIRLNAQRDAPVGGQAVLEGVMMRGVGNWAVAVRRPPEMHRRGRPVRGGRGRRDRGANLSTDLCAQAPPRAASADHPRRGGAGGIADGGHPRARGRGERAAANARAGARRGAEGGDLARRLGRHGGRGGGVCDRPVLRGPRRADEPDQGAARLPGAVLAGRGPAADGDLPRLPHPALAYPRPASGVRVPRGRAQDDLLPGGGAPADASPTARASRDCIRAAERASCWW